MKYLLMATCLSLFVGFTVKTTNMQLDYQNGNGTTEANYLFIETQDVSFEQDDFLADLLLVENGLQITINGANILLKNGIDQFLVDQNNVQANIPMADFQTNSSSALITSLYTSGNTNVDLSDVELECDSGQRQEYYPLIDQCLVYGLLKAAKLDLEEMQQIFAKALQFNRRDKIELKNIFLNIDQGEVTLSLKAKQGLTVSVRIKAYAERRDNILDVKLKSAKASFLDIKRRILDAIKEMNSESIIVSGDHILITM